jgi:hypothetical protein
VTDQQSGQRFGVERRFSISQLRACSSVEAHTFGVVVHLTPASPRVMSMW